jgi:hypothetical protein
MARRRSPRIRGSDGSVVAPHANKLMVHMLAAFADIAPHANKLMVFAEHEREQISQRTKDALAAANTFDLADGTPVPSVNKQNDQHGSESVVMQSAEWQSGGRMTQSSLRMPISLWCICWPHSLREPRQRTSLYCLFRQMSGSFWPTFEQLSSFVVCCGHVGNALALSIMSTATRFVSGPCICDGPLSANSA